MSTRILESRTAAALKRRIRLFYDLMNRRDFEACFRMIDPDIREDPNAVTLYQYENSLRRFMKRFGVIQIRDLTLELYLNTPNILYHNRDFAMGALTWEDKSGESHLFKQRWVRDGRSWYTVSVGLVTPDA